MSTAIDVFAKVRGHERSEQLQAAREAAATASRAVRDGLTEIGAGEGPVNVLGLAR